jgi:CheY-like chemotaxis protein
VDDHEFEEPIHLLLVEDNPGDVRLVREAFERVSIETSIQVATDGREALESLQQRRDDPASLPDIVLLDLNLPRVDGFAVLEAMNEDPRLAKIPVLVVTGSRAVEDVVKSYERSANTFLTKPATLEEFVAMANSIEEFWFRHALLPPA